MATGSGVFDWSLFQEITKRARETIDPDAGLRVEGGKIQLVRVVYGARGVSTVTPLGPWVPVRDIQCAF